MTTDVFLVLKFRVLLLFRIRQIFKQWALKTFDGTLLTVDGPS